VTKRVCYSLTPIGSGSAHSSASSASKFSSCSNTSDMFREFFAFFQCLLGEIVFERNLSLPQLAAELAALHNRSLSVIQMDLLKKWLAFAPGQHAVESALEETFYEDFVMADHDNSRSDGLSDEFVVRAHYILSSWPADEAIQLLITEMTSDGSSNNTGKQLQIFECFFKLIDSTTNPDLFEMIQQDNFVAIKCVHYLKQLGYTLSQENFTGADKLAFLKRLWQQHANNGKGLEVMAYICLGYEIAAPQIWNGILKQMVNLKMVSFGFYPSNCELWVFFPFSSSNCRH
jgi:kinetochore-associated protein 1